MSFNNLKLCFISGADNGETYILNWDIPPSKVPAKFCSINILVFRPENVVPLKSFVGKHSGSWMYGPNGDVDEENVKFSLKPWVPPPHETLKGTPTCFSLSVFNPLGIISSKSSIV